MIFRKVNFVLILSLLFVIPSVAQNFNDALLLSEPGIYNNARALGMGNSYTALSNDFSSVIFNPAGLGLAKKLGISGGIDLNSFDNTASFLGNNTISTQNEVNLSQVGFVYPVPTIKGSMVFALGYNRVKNFNGIVQFDGFNNSNTSMIQFLTGDFNEEVPITNDLGLSYEVRNPQTDEYIRDTTRINGQLNQSGKVKSKGNIGNWSFAGSIEIAKDLYVGGTFNIVSGNYKRNRDYYEDDTKDIYGANTELVPGDVTTKDFQTFYFNDIIDWDLSGWDFKLGLLYDWENFVKFGATVKFPTYYTVKESYFATGESEFGSGSNFAVDPPIIDNVQYDIRTPYEYSAGASVNLVILTVSGEAKLIDYTQMEFTKGLGQQYRIERNKEIDDLFRTAVTYNLGAEMKVPFLPVWGRAGAMYMQSPFKDDPSDFDKKYLTAGVGVKLGGVFSIDFGYAYGWWKTFTDNYGSGVSRVQHDVTVQNVVLTISTALN